MVKLNFSCSPSALVHYPFLACFLRSIFFLSYNLYFLLYFFCLTIYEKIVFIFSQRHVPIKNSYSFLDFISFHFHFFFFFISFLLVQSTNFDPVKMTQDEVTGVYVMELVSGLATWPLAAVLVNLESHWQLPVPARY